MENHNGHKEINFDLEEQILAKAKDLFTSIGIRNTTMEDIAKDLGISKKTLYKAIENKSDLVTKCMLHDLELKKSEMYTIIKTYSNPIEQMLQLGAHILFSFKQHKISLIHDLMKFYPESWYLVVEYKETYVKEIIKNNLRKGIQLGIYRKDIQVDIYANFFMSGTDISNSENVFPELEFDFSNIFREFLFYHLRGIVSEKAVHELDKLIEKIKF